MIIAAPGQPASASRSMDCSSGALKHRRAQSADEEDTSHKWGSIQWALFRWFTEEEKQSKIEHHMDPSKPVLATPRHRMFLYCEGIRKGETSEVLAASSAVPSPKSKAPKCASGKLLQKAIRTLRQPKPVGTQSDGAAMDTSESDQMPAHSAGRGISRV